MITIDHLIKNPIVKKPHVVVLGAGASKASFPNGDANGKPILVMNEIIKFVGLNPYFEEIDENQNGCDNFEVLYDSLISNPENQNTASDIEKRIKCYFSDMELPDEATIYDRTTVRRNVKGNGLTHLKI